jgi:hypothetical protein
MMAAPLVSLAATGLSAMGSIAGAEGQSKADQYQAKQAIDAAEYGRVKAAQTGQIMTQNMSTMLGHIAAVRASGGADVRSPTTAAIVGRQEQISTNERGIQVGNIQNQVRSDVDSSKLYTQMAGQALTAGYLGAAGTVAGSLGGAFKSAGSSFNFFQ